MAYRVSAPPPPPPPPAVDVDISTPAPSEPGIVQTGDGGVVVYLNGATPKPQSAAKPRKDFKENLAEHLEDAALSVIASDLIQGIDADIQSRTEMVGAYARGIDLLGLKVESASTGGAKKKRTSTVRHPLLIQAVVDFQSQASAELMPANGPAKVRDDKNELPIPRPAAPPQAPPAIPGTVPGPAGLGTPSVSAGPVAGAVQPGLGHNGGPALEPDRDALAAAFEKDLNHYLTVTATEYYPDLDRGLFYLGYGGCIFRKAYHCPIRKRPVVETVYLTDLIVSEDANDLDSAVRVTQKIDMTPHVLKRMQLAGVYRDIDLAQPMPDNDPAKAKIAATSGLQPNTTRPQDTERVIYECYTTLDLSEHGYDEPGAPEGLPLPYRVSIDKDSQQVLEIQRNWKEGDENYLPRKRFVMYGLIPGLGFLPYGLLHLLGNSTRTLTAIWRILVDAGMFANFPAGLRVKGTRQSNNEISPGPGEFPEIDTGPMQDIRQAIMPLPYKDPSAVFIQFQDAIAKTVQQIGASMNMPLGEGVKDIPVGTMMAMIEQGTKTMSAIHKRMHRSQQQELQLIKDLFAEDPEALCRYCKKPSRKWQTAAEFQDVDLVPASDPNVPSQVHRILLAAAIKTISANNPNFDQRKVDEKLLRAAGVADPQSLMTPAGQQPNMDPAAMAGAAKLMLEARRDEQKQQAELQRAQIAARSAEQKAASEERVAQVELHELELRNAQQDEDRAGRERIALINQETARIQAEADLAQAEAQRRDQREQHATDKAHETAQHLTGLAVKVHDIEARRETAARSEAARERVAEKAAKAKAAKPAGGASGKKPKKEPK